MEALIDADQMVYATGFVTEDEPESHAFHLINKVIETILTDTGSDHYQVFIKGTGNFRDELAEDYKGHRDPRKPKHYDAIRNYLVDRYGAVRVDNMEADDRVSIEHCQAKHETVIVSPDKDLNNTPGLHYNYQKNILYNVSLEQADRHFLYQMLAGDKVDNIPGLRDIPAYLCKREGWHKAVGEKTAKKMMEIVRGKPLSSQWSFVMALYETTGEGWQDRLFLNQKLLHMCRSEAEATAAYRLPWYGEEEEYEYWRDWLREDEAS